ncbi:MAG: FtsX-like permease family protein [Thermodesulfobacteriota bacterium]|nr:FtsX-like permease family protein [Thermodesulfobacteriota bacterium]
MMDTISFAWKNLWHHRRRTLITLLGISMALMLTQTLHNLAIGSYSQIIESGVRSGSGHFAIYHHGYRQDHDEKMTFAVGQLPHTLATSPHIEFALPRIHISGLAQSSHDSRAVAIMGINMVTEAVVNPLLRQLPQDQWLRAEQPRDALLGRRLLEELQIRLGQKLVLTVQDRDGNLVSELLRVRGIIDSRIKQIDSTLVMIGREKAAEITGLHGQIHELAIVLHNAGVMPQLHDEIGQRVSKNDNIELVAWQVSMPNLADAIRLDYASQNVMLVIILLIITIGIVNTLLMSVMERIHEFGIMLAMGATPLRLWQLILCESAILGAAAATFGTVLGSLSTWYLVEVGIDLRDFISENMEFGGVVFEPIIRATWTPMWMLESALYIVLLSIVAALYPAFKAARLSPVDAMRHS